MFSSSSHLKDSQQDKVFTRFCNAQLAPLGVSIPQGSLTKGRLDDGIVLWHLLGVLVGPQITLPKINFKPNAKIQQMSNLSVSLEFLKKQGVGQGIGAQDIYSRNANLVLGLVWNIVLKFHIAPTLAQKGPPEKDFLLWLAHKDICISKLAKFSDSNLRSLLFALRPNLELGKGNVIDEAFQHFGVPALLDMEDFKQGIDSYAMMTYLSYFRFLEINGLLQSSKSAMIYKEMPSMSNSRGGDAGYDDSLLSVSSTYFSPRSGSSGETSPFTKATSQSLYSPPLSPVRKDNNYNSNYNSNSNNTTKASSTVNSPSLNAPWKRSTTMSLNLTGFSNSSPRPPPSFLKASPPQHVQPQSSPFATRLNATTSDSSPSLSSANFIHSTTTATDNASRTNFYGKPSSYRTQKRDNTGSVTPSPATTPQKDNYRPYVSSNPSSPLPSPTRQGNHSIATPPTTPTTAQQRSKATSLRDASAMSGATVTVGASGNGNGHVAKQAATMTPITIQEEFIEVILVRNKQPDVAVAPSVSTPDTSPSPTPTPTPPVSERKFTKTRSKSKSRSRSGRSKSKTENNPTIQTANGQGKEVLADRDDTALISTPRKLLQKAVSNKEDAVTMRDVIGVDIPALDLRQILLQKEQTSKALFHSSGSGSSTTKPKGVKAIRARTPSVLRNIKTMEAKNDEDLRAYYAEYVASNYSPQVASVPFQDNIYMPLPSLSNYTLSRLIAIVIDPLGNLIKNTKIVEFPPSILNQMQSVFIIYFRSATTGRHFGQIYNSSDQTKLFATPIAYDVYEPEKKRVQRTLPIFNIPDFVGPKDEFSMQEVRIRLVGPDMSLLDAELIELPSGLHAVRFIPNGAGIYACQLYYGSYTLLTRPYEMDVESNQLYSLSTPRSKSTPQTGALGSSTASLSNLSYSLSPRGPAPSRKRDSIQTSLDSSSQSSRATRLGNSGKDLNRFGKDTTSKEASKEASKETSKEASHDSSAAPLTPTTPSTPVTPTPAQADPIDQQQQPCRAPISLVLSAPPSSPSTATTQLAPHQLVRSSQSHSHVPSASMQATGLESPKSTGSDLRSSASMRDGLNSGGQRSTRRNTRSYSEAPLASLSSRREIHMPYNDGASGLAAQSRKKVGPEGDGINRLRFEVLAPQGTLIFGTSFVIHILGSSDGAYFYQFGANGHVGSFSFQIYLLGSSHPCLDQPLQIGVAQPTRVSIVSLNLSNEEYSLRNLALSVKIFREDTPKDPVANSTEPSSTSTNTRSNRKKKQKKKKTSFSEEVSGVVSFLSNHWLLIQFDPPAPGGYCFQLYKNENEPVFTDFNYIFVEDKLAFSNG